MAGLLAMDAGERGHAATRNAATNRRGFLAAASGVLGLLVGVVLAAPVLGALVGPAFRRARRHFSRAGRVSGLPPGRPILVRFRQRKVDAYLVENVTHDAWAVRHGAAGVTVFSPICPHLGCRYEWIPAQQHFYCPCHHSVFALDGRVLGGPAPRPLDTLPSEIRDGELHIEWERFEPGIPEKKAV